MRKATAISAGLHVAVLLWASLSLSSRALNATPPDSLPVDILSEKQFSEMTKGAKDAPKPVEKQKPLVEKKAEPKAEVEDIKPKLTEKQEVKPTADKPPEPQKAPEPKKPEKQEAKAEEKKPDPKPEEKKPDAIAKELKKEEDKKLKEAKAEPKAPKKPAKKEYKDFQQLAEAALKDVREPQRHAATGDELNPNATLGRAKGLAAQLSQSEIDALRERIKQCWQPPLGAEDAQDLQVVFHVMFNQNGTVLRGPDVVEGAPSSLGPIFAESARRAILQCQPYTMLHKEHYAQWRDMEMVFNLRDMFR
ncbi:MAG TPA: protein TolA [Pseudolabrys sp.]|jgi:colicin import membrane protein